MDGPLAIGSLLASARAPAVQIIGSPLGRLAAVGRLVLAEVDQAPGELVDPSSEHVMLVQPRTSGPTVRCDFGAGWFQRRIERGDLFLTAPRAAAHVAIDRAHTVRSAMIPTHLFEELEANPTDFGWLHAQAFCDRTLDELLNRLWQSVDNAELASRLEAEGLMLLLLARLLRLRSGRPAAAPTPLAPWQQRRVTDYVVENLDQDVTIAELGSLIGRSPYHFARAFKASLGETPHRYLVRRRIERSKQLLQTGDLSVADVAVAVGYAAPQAFARAFKAIVGVSPTQYRRGRP